MYLVSYDVSSDKLRNKVVKVLEAYGQRVQYSVFECHLDTKQYRQMYRKLIQTVENHEGCSIRLYQLCGKCEKNIQTIGTEKEILTPEEQDLFII